MTDTPSPPPGPRATAPRVVSQVKDRDEADAICQSMLREGYFHKCEKISKGNMQVGATPPSRLLGRSFPLTPTGHHALPVPRGGQPGAHQLAVPPTPPALDRPLQLVALATARLTAPFRLPRARTGGAGRVVARRLSSRLCLVARRSCRRDARGVLVAAVQYCPNQRWEEQAFYSWDYDGSKTMSHMMTGALIVGFLAVTCFPIWPQFLKVHPRA